MSEVARTGLRARLADPDARLVAVFASIPRVEVAELLAVAGADVVLLDGEHGSFDVSDLPGVIAAVQGAGAAAVVRVAELRAQVIAAALDAGADGVLVPHVRTADDAREAVAATRFPPAGRRSVHGAVRAARYGATTDHLAASDARCAVLVMCEDADALEVIDDIVGVDGLDGVFVGSFDLSASMGFLGRPAHPEVAAATKRVFAAAERAGIAASLMSPTPDAAAGWFEAGARMVVAGVDTALFRGAVASAVEQARPPRS